MTDLLEWIVKERGKPKAIRTDNGPEFTSSTFTNWSHKHRIEIRYIQPGKHVQNAFIERFTEVIEQRFWMQGSLVT
ncbi:DDE-type integrase/transposase/recombinase [Chryseobacterium sp. PS-8]|uniref:DDE-type integrase/transposase/recombinase n=1 Tax=Chryseobacterium indicum TaxID=2766954 RepID=A0ABS9C648_9FLAO|nr:DDE-type integrase/transposase/recombinase [Chryseobacterium sp. PS-8]MCF2220039.1 DDE-type integrase/transposase/recombinase [Chryseobacterium sp. PS-8]